MDIQKQDEIKLHKKLVKHYGSRYGHDFSKVYHDYWNRQILNGLPQSPSLFVLDCGCGNGILFSSLTQRYENVFGLDLSFEFAASNKFKGLVVGDTENLPFADNCFDIVICRGSLHHMPRPQQAIGQICAKLKPGGFFVLSEPCDDSLILRIPRKIFWERSGRFTSGHKAFGSKELKVMLSDHGLKIDQARKFGLIAFPLCGLSDFFPIMKFLVFRKALANLFIFIDEIASRIPFLKDQCWHILIKSQKYDDKRTI